MSSRSKRAQIAAETVQLVKNGWYMHPVAGRVDFSQSVSDALRNTRHFAPEDFETLFRERDAIVAKESGSTKAHYTVANMTTLEAARKLLSDNSSPVLALNFASAKNPGGGFLGGSQAQEESLARASAMYECINGVRGFYDTNRACESCVYTHHMIYSPSVPVFRDDNDELLPSPYQVSILTAPAVNRGALQSNEPSRLVEIAPTMLERIDRLLAIAVVRGYRRLILGAWGCGVFKNDPAEVAAWFAEHLNGPCYGPMFETVMFAVLDQTKSGDVIAPFHRMFSERAMKAETTERTGGRGC